VAKTSFISKRRRRDHPIVRNAGYGVSRISPDAIGQDLIKLAPIKLAQSNWQGQQGSNL
jgi:hypothetical protein